APWPARSMTAAKLTGATATPFVHLGWAPGSGPGTSHPIQVCSNRHAAHRHGQRLPHKPLVLSTFRLAGARRGGPGVVRMPGLWARGAPASSSSAGRPAVVSLPGGPFRGEEDG